MCCSFVEWSNGFLCGDVKRAGYDRSKQLKERRTGEKMRGL